MKTVAESRVKRPSKKKSVPPPPPSNVVTKSSGKPSGRALALFVGEVTYLYTRVEEAFTAIVEEAKPLEDETRRKAILLEAVGGNALAQSLTGLVKLFEGDFDPLQALAAHNAIQALKWFSWPSGLDPKAVKLVSDKVIEEALSHLDAYIPVSFWEVRISDELRKERAA